jgi:hypothetical protein
MIPKLLSWDFAGMLVNKSQFQLANVEEQRKKAKGVRIDSNGFSHIVTHSSFLAASKRVAQDSVTKVSLSASIHALERSGKCSMTHRWGHTRSGKMRRRTARMQENY